MKQTSPKHKYSRLERISIAVNVGIYILAIAILFYCWWLLAGARGITADVTDINEEVTSTTETSLLAGEEKENLVPIITAPRKERPLKVHFEKFQNDVEEVKTTEPEHHTVIERGQSSISEWCMSHENKEPLTIWKVTDEEGNFYVGLKNEKNEFIATFKLEGINSQSYYEDWTVCDYFFDVTTTRDIIDYGFLAYHEVSGNNSENVQAQIIHAINRMKAKDFPDSIRKVITDTKYGIQYTSSTCVVGRYMKKGTRSEEKADLEKCFEQVLLVLAGELIQEVPEDVIYAGTCKNGSGVWKVIEGTYYCYR